MRQRPTAWIQKDIDWFYANLQTKNVYEMSTHLKRTVPSLRAYAKKVGVTLLRKVPIIRGKPHGRAWTEEEFKILRELAGKATTKEIADRLNRTKLSVHQRAMSKGISLSVLKKAWTKEETLKLLDCEYLTVAQLAKKLGRSKYSVGQKMRSLGYSALCAYHTVTSARRETGYAETQLWRARRALKQKWRWVQDGGSNGRYLITHDQLEDLCNWLKKETWKRNAA